MIQRVLALLILLSLQLFARHYDDTLLSIEAKLFPKIAMLEKHIREKDSSRLSLVILSKKRDISTAKELKSKILKNYPNKILNKKVYVDIKHPRDILDRDIDAVILLYNKEKTIKNLLAWSNKHTILTLSYDAFDLKHGVVASIYLGKSTKPYLNTSVIKKYNFVFDSYLLSVSKFTQ